MEFEEISREDFEAYEKVRSSGVTNMWAVDVVCQLSGLEREKVMYIMHHYSELIQKFPGVRK